MLLEVCWLVVIYGMSPQDTESPWNCFCQPCSISLYDFKSLCYHEGGNCWVIML